MNQFDLNKERFTHPFKVPNGYFDKLKAKVVENSENLSNVIKSSNVKNPFSVPDLYFDQLSDRILDNIDEEKTRRLNPNTGNNLWFGVAAAATVLLSITLLFQNNRATLDTNVLADISNDEILFYLDYYEMDEMELIETIDDNMEWVNDEDQLLNEMDLGNTIIDNLYLEFGLSETI